MNWLVLSQDPLFVQSIIKLLFLELLGPHLISVEQFSEEAGSPKSTYPSVSILSKNLVTKTMRCELNK